MFEANVNAVGVAAKSFEGAALHMMQKILKERKESVLQVTNNASCR